jgi:threonine dehydrogenase-like Zn-dependent dehydrogenase
LPIALYTMKAVTITAKETAELTNFLPDLSGPVPARHVRGRSLMTLTSPGTELNYNYLGGNNAPFPNYPGYAAVFELTEIGEDAGPFKVGDRVMAMGGHREFQQTHIDGTHPVPKGLKAEIAVFARLMSVSMSTLNTAAAHPPARVLVTGLGPVGNIAAQLFARCGYQVTAVDPVESCRFIATACGLEDVRKSVWDEPADIEGRISLHVECSGHEQAVLDGCKCVKKRGEVVMVGVPWKRRTDIPAFEVLYAVFHKYVVLRSGWEWEIPHNDQDFKHNSIYRNLEAALSWLDEGSINVSPLLSLYSPSECQKVYQGLLTQTLKTPAAVFDWNKL